MTPFDSTVRQPSNLDVPVHSPSAQPACGSSLKLQGVGVTADATPLAASVPSPSSITPWLMSLAYPLGRYGVVPFYFQQVEVVGREHLPRTGPVILAPMHRSRWDAILVPFAAGRDITGRHLRFMVTADEMRGLQGWFIRHMGGFPIDTKHPAIASLRYGLELLQAGEALVIFPEGDIFRQPEPQSLKPGLARLALQAESSQANLGVQIVPLHIQYSQPMVPWRSRAKISIGAPLKVADYNAKSPKQNAKSLTADLYQALQALPQLA